MNKNDLVEKVEQNLLKRFFAKNVFALILLIFLDHESMIEL